MTHASIVVPALGEGLQEVRVVRLLKRCGESVKRDEPICEIETDKAVSELESSHDGTLVEWLGGEGELVPIGAPLARIEVQSEPMPPSTGISQDHGQEVYPLQVRNAEISPRLQRYLKAKGLWSQRQLIPSESGKLSQKDIDAFLAKQQAEGTSPTAGAEEAPQGSVEPDEERFELSPRQFSLMHHLMNSAGRAVPASITTAVNWQAIKDPFDNCNKVSEDTLRPTPVLQVAWAVVHAMGSYPKFRCIASDGSTFRQSAHVNLGIAVSLPEDELGTAVIESADHLNWEQFARAMRRAIKRTLKGERQALEKVSLIVSDVSTFDIVDAVPVLVAPAVATLSIGTPFWQMVPLMGSATAQRIGFLSLTFDHRLINGVGAAKFLESVKRGVEQRTTQYAS